MIVQEKFNPFPRSLLPDGFYYPNKYLSIAKNPKLVSHNKSYHFRWWFDDYGTESAELSYQFRGQKVPNKNLIPFAQNGDWKAYFDGDDTSGNPQVIVVDLTNLPFHVLLRDFNEWLSIAENDKW